MFGFLGRLLCRLFFGRDTADDPYVFSYFDGQKKRTIDPLEVENAFTEILGDNWRSKIAQLAKPAVPPGVIGTEAAELLKTRRELNTTILDAIDKVFDVQPYKDGRGLTIAKRHGLIAAYNWFCVDILRAARPFVMPQSRASPSTASPPESSGAGFSSAAT